MVNNALRCSYEATVALHEPLDHFASWLEYWAQWLVLYSNETSLVNAMVLVPSDLVSGFMIGAEFPANYAPLPGHVTVRD